MYSHIKRRELLERDRLNEALRLVCAFINPKMANDIFKDREESVSEGFLDDLKAINPNFDPERDKDILEALAD